MVYHCYFLFASPLLHFILAGWQACIQSTANHQDCDPNNLTSKSVVNQRHLWKVDNRAIEEPPIDLEKDLGLQYGTMALGDTENMATSLPASHHLFGGREGNMLDIALTQWLHWGQVGEVAKGAGHIVPQNQSW